MTQTRLVFLSPMREQASRYLIVDAAGDIVARGMLTPHAPATSAKVRTVLIVPGTEVLARWIELPSCPPAQAAAAAALILKDETGTALETIHLAFGAAEADGFRPVCMVDRNLMQSFIDRSSELGISPDAVTPDHLMLPVPSDGGILTVALGATRAARGPRLAFSAEPELSELIIAGRAQQRIQHQGDIDALFARAVAQPPIDLLQQEFARGNSRPLARKDFRRAAVLACAAILSPALVWAVQIVHDERSAAALEARAVASARAVPGAGQTGDPILYLNGRLADLRASDRFLQSTAALFNAVSHIEGAELDSFFYLREGIIRATLVHDKSSDVPGLARSLSRSSISLEEDAAVQKQGRIFTTVSLKLRP